MRLCPYYYNIGLFNEKFNKDEVVGVESPNCYLEKEQYISW
jgi:hypothetical protein